MSTAEEQELLAQINKLEGRISRHKAAQQNGARYQTENHRTLFCEPTRLATADVLFSAPYYSPRGNYRTAPYPRGSYRGRGHAPTYRNRTLVLNGQRPSATSDATAGGDGNKANASYVTRTDRHLQLINTSVFEKDVQARASAIEQTQRQKRLQKEQMEKARVMNFLQHNASSVPPVASNPTTAAAGAPKYEVTVDGIRFQITKRGSKLVRAPGMSSRADPRGPGAKLRTDDKNPPSATPKVTTIGGVKFYRTKSGNLVRHGIAKAQQYVASPVCASMLTPARRLACGIKKVNVPCKTFSWTGIVFSEIIVTKSRPA